MSAQQPPAPARRADAERNRGKILAVARTAFADPGAEVSMAEISRRAGVGMATLYRNFPGRQELLEALYTDEVDAVCEAAEGTGAGTPGAALVAWLHRFSAFTTSKRHIASELLKQTDRSDPLFEDNRTRVITAGRPLLAAAQYAREVRDDITLEQILDMIVAIAAIRGTGLHRADPPDRTRRTAPPGLRVTGPALMQPHPRVNSGRGGARRRCTGHSRSHYQYSGNESQAATQRQADDKTRAPVTRKMGGQRVRANRRMPMTDSRAPVRSHQRSRHERTGLVARDSPSGVDRFDSRFRRCDCSLMAASYPPGSRDRVYSAYTELYASWARYSISSAASVRKARCCAAGSRAWQRRCPSARRACRSRRGKGHRTRSGRRAGFPRPG